MAVSNRTRNFFSAAALSVAGLAMAWQQWSAYNQERLLDAGGVTAQGTVIDVRVDKYESTVRVEYTPPGGSPLTREVGVSRAVAMALRNDHARKEVTIRYLPHDQEVADIAGGSAVDGTKVLFTLGLFGLAAWALRLALRTED